ncbi:MAG: pyruvate kinase [Defluviitaleaceae bacterium]|nr:pyruvate kinase [Defluviitaleaceae bacterium]
MRKTKILATLGPASNRLDTIKGMIDAGLDAARINFSHGTYESHGKLVETLKKARKQTGKPIPIILDTKGPEIRTKMLSGDKIYLEQGAEFTLTTQDIVGDQTRVAVTYENLPRDLEVGSRVLIDDGLIEMKVMSITDTDIKCELVNSGFLGNRKGINVPDVYVDLPSLTEKDIEDIKFGIENEFDYIAASFVRTANDIINIRKVLEENGGGHMRIIAKIESRDGVDNLDSILEVVDGVMVARGDLGVEIPPEEVPVVQKDMIRKCNLVGKPVITATQMLESMVNNPRPTRAEANDVANAIFDGTDVVMLSGETANGKYPVETIDMMARIAMEAEKSIDYKTKYASYYRNINKNITNAISHAAVTTAADMGASCIVAITDSGFAARMVSRSRPDCPILAVTSSPVVYRQCNLTWGCLPVLSPRTIEGDSEVFDIAEEVAVKCGAAKNGEIIVALAGVPIGSAGTTNTLRVRTVGDVLASGEGNKRGIVKGITRVFDGNMEETGRFFFEQGDIIICTNTDDSMMDYIKKAGAIVIGSWDKLDYSHAETVAKALDLPMLKLNVKAVDFVKSGLDVTVDTNEGHLLNGYK